MRISLILSLLLAANLAGRSQTPRDAVASALAVSVPPERILLPIEPMSRAIQSKWTVHHAHFDRSLQSWLLELRCARPARCVPMLAIVSVGDPSLVLAQNTRPKIVVRAGESKPLVANSGPIRISHPVTCLRSGSAGDKIPVRAQDSRQLQFATVGVDGTLSPWSAR